MHQLGIQSLAEREIIGLELPGVFSTKLRLKGVFGRLTDLDTAVAG
jgi:hypothetical protein